MMFNFEKKIRKFIINDLQDNHTLDKMVKLKKFNANYNLDFFSYLPNKIKVDDLKLIA